MVYVIQDVCTLSEHYIKYLFDLLFRLIGLLLL